MGEVTYVQKILITESKRDNCFGGQLKWTLKKEMRWCGLDLSGSE